jgi:hypothetical protein
MRRRDSNGARLFLLLAICGRVNKVSRPDLAVFGLDGSKGMSLTVKAHDPAAISFSLDRK